MSRKKMAAIAIAVLGLIFMGISGFISKHVTEGKMKIEMSQKKAETTNPSFSMSKYAKPVGSADQKQLNIGQKRVAKHEKLSKVLWGGGIILILVGAGLFYFWRKE